MSYAQWVPTAYYEPTDVVYDGSLAYQCLVANGPPTPQQPSVSPLFWAELSVADITAVLAGTGISVATPGGPTPTVNNTGVLSVGVGTGISNTGTASAPVLNNTGVLSLDGATGALTTKVGGAYKTVVQNLTSGTTFVTWDADFPWNDTGYITRTSADTFTVDVKGLYQLEHQITVGVNGASWLATSNKLAAITLTRAPIAEQVLFVQSSVQAIQAYGFMLSGLVELEVGDTIRCRHTNTFTSGPPQISALVNTYDYNTTFTWQLIKPLP